MSLVPPSTTEECPCQETNHSDSDKAEPCQVKNIATVQSSIQLVLPLELTDVSLPWDQTVTITVASRYVSETSFSFSQAKIPLLYDAINEHAPNAPPLVVL